MGTSQQTEQVRVKMDRPVLTRSLSEEPQPEFEWQERTVEKIIIKTISFSDGTKYIVPHEIASEAHNRE